MRNSFFFSRNFPFAAMSMTSRVQSCQFIAWSIHSAFLPFLFPSLVVFCLYFFFYPMLILPVLISHSLLFLMSSSTIIIIIIIIIVFIIDWDLICIIVFIVFAAVIIIFIWIIMITLWEMLSFVFIIYEWFKSIMLIDFLKINAKLVKGHHHVELPAPISLTLACHPSLSSIAPSRPSWLYLVSEQSCYINLLAGRPNFGRPCEGVHSRSLLSSSLLLQKSPAFLVRLIWIIFVMGGRCPYSCCLVGCYLQALLNIAHSILV